MSKPPVIDLLSSSEDENNHIEVTGYGYPASSSSSPSGGSRKRPAPRPSSSSSPRARPSNRPTRKRRAVPSVAARSVPLQAGIVLEEDITADPRTTTGKIPSRTSSDDEAEEAISCQSYVEAQLHRIRCSSAATLYHDPDFEPVPSSIDGASAHSPILDGGSNSTVPKSKMEKCRCSPAQPAVLAYSTRAGPNMHKPYYTCAKKRCKHFKWAFQSHVMRWHRFGPHSGHVLVGPSGFRAEDLLQGKVGDCWFLSALAVVAERPDLIARLFGTMAGMNEHGICEVRIFIDGFWRNIVMDNFLPCIVDPANDELGRAIQASRQEARHDWGAVAGTADGTALISPSSVSLSSSSSEHDPNALAESNLNVIRQTNEYLEQDRFKKNGPLPPGQRSPFGRDVPRRLGRTVETEDLAYSKAKSNQLWVPILEKAYAKAHGCYKAMSGGHIAEAFLDLTGSPTIVYDFDAADFNARAMWSDLMSFRRRRLPMGCGTSSSAAGIIGMHAYSILDVREIPNVDLEFFRESLVKGTLGNVSGFTEFDGTVRLLRIRNPHGKGEWKGDFSDGSKMWEKLLANRRDSFNGANSPGLERTMANDGTFWIDYDNFLMGFSNVDVVLAFQGNHAKSFASNFPPKQSNHRCARAFEVALLDEQPGMSSNDEVELYVMGIQKNKRGSKHGRADRKKSYKICDLGLIIGKHGNGGRSAFESKDEDSDLEFDHVDGHMFGFQRNGHYRLLLHRKTCKSLVVIPISLGHPTASDKELSFVLRFVADAPVLIRELEHVPHIDTTLNKLFFGSKSSAINANTMGTSSSRGIQGSQMVILNDKEGKRMHGEPFFRVYKIDYLGSEGGVVFVYLAVNDALLQKKGIKNYAVSLSVEATCRGMMCRTAKGLQQHETIAKGKKFEAAWRKFSCTFDDETRSRLLMVLVQSGVSTEMGIIKCEKLATLYGGLTDTKGGNTLDGFLGVTGARDDYKSRGIFHPVACNDSSIFQRSHISTCSAGIVDESAGGQSSETDPGLETALVMSRQNADLQRAIEASANRTAVRSREHSFSDYEKEMEAAIAASMATASSTHSTASGGNDADSSYFKDLELATKLSAQETEGVGGWSPSASTAVVDLLGSPDSKPSCYAATSVAAASFTRPTTGGGINVDSAYSNDLESATKLSAHEMKGEKSPSASTADVVGLIGSADRTTSLYARTNDGATITSEQNNCGDDDDRKPSPAKENKKPHENKELDVAERRKLAAEAALKRFRHEQ